MDALDLTLPCDPCVLRPLRDRVGEWLRERAVPEETCSSAMLATHEATANAMEHARNCRSIEVRVRRRRRAIVVEVHDDGRWSHATFDDAERGRGLMLMAGLTSKMEILAEPTGTIVRMVHVV